ncbi:Uncharacterized conserved protein YcbK, DUF882 family [Rhizobium sp. RU20A]|uniref:YcbK family protein n=1 Tax=Rhizobium sp. RU20A TaxID=1907412 RepID=UPI0009568AAF|nr:D-Ala-D-Ala carboxypeptidase family metallohydrolase [Rhizobium sp. RU20A]SIQ02631.1 Uncharacterized conserved protein YcbK, DUF882 family [Rhizobium sp. RU20A]
MSSTERATPGQSLAASAAIAGFAIAGLFFITGCSTTQGDLLASTATTPAPAEQSAPAAQAAATGDPAQQPATHTPGYRDPAVAALGGAPAGANPATQQMASEVPLQAAAAAGQPLAMQSTGVNAMANPIYSTTARSGALVSTDGGPQTQVAPVSNSLFRAQVTGSVPADAGPQALPQQGASAVLPPATAAATAEVAAADPSMLPPATSGSDETGGTPGTTPDALALAALAAAKRKQRGEAAEVAALGFAPHQGGGATQPAAGKHNRMLYDDYDDGAAEEPAVTEVAMLPGLARLAPNGLWLQTGTVDTGCFKPDLLNVLRSIEAHYGKKLVVTSGFRDPRRPVGARHSLHATCDAADIQIPGVNKWELASYLRSMPGRGGVGTYCHTESVHIDIGEQRDWNWRCRRRKS